MTRIALPGHIGRAADCALVLADPEVSAQHAVLDETGAINDLESANGMWLAGERVSTHALTEEPIHLGQTSLQLLMLASEQSQVIAIRSAGQVHQRRQVLRLPAVVSLASTGELKTTLQGTMAVLSTGEQIQLLRWVSGALEYTEPDPDGLVPLGSHYLKVSHARDVVSLPTDLAFDVDGEIRPQQNLTPRAQGFPPPLFANSQVSISALQETGLPIIESPFLALGGGLGSFCWVDALRVHGVSRDSITVVGFEDTPYARYARLCRNSQIPDHERLRSNSESCPDNYWGFPGYGMRESWTQLKRAQPFAAAGTLWKLIAEPDRAATYTPRAGDVFASIDKEAKRIGWSEMLHTGRIRSIRKTDDERYAVAVSSRAAPEAPRAIYLTPILHTALGYPGVQFLADLRAYREQTHDFTRVVNAYEDHNALYERLLAVGGTVVLRGRGIVASRVLQRIHELRQAGGKIAVIHLMRSPNERGSRAGLAQRRVQNHWEFQPFNWPEACWGGDLRAVLASVAPAKRQELLRDWGGTTTADRPDWRNIVSEGLRSGWYQIVFATIEQFSGNADSLSLSLSNGKNQNISCDYIIDATGLISSIHANPVLADLVETYALPLNIQGRLEVDSSFELSALRNGSGRAFVSGICTLGSHYAPVDSFLGLQYAAAASLDALGSRVPPLSMLTSMAAWWRWLRAEAP